MLVIFPIILITCEIKVVKISCKIKVVKMSINVEGEMSIN